MIGNIINFQKPYLVPILAFTAFWGRRKPLEWGSAAPLSFRARLMQSSYFIVYSYPFLSYFKVPLSWSSRLEGPEDPIHWLRALVAKTLALGSWVEKCNSNSLLKDVLDLSELLHPDTFLNALRQQTAR